MPGRERPKPNNTSQKIFLTAPLSERNPRVILVRIGDPAGTEEGKGRQGSAALSQAVDDLVMSIPKKNGCLERLSRVVGKVLRVTANDCRGPAILMKVGPPIQV